MKKTNIILAFSILSVIFFVSCKQKTIKTIDKNHTERYFLSSDTTKGAMSIDISVQIPVGYDNEVVLDSIRKEIFVNLFGNEYATVDYDSVIQKFTSNIVAEYKLNNEPLLEKLDSTSLYSFNNEHTLEGFSLLNDEKIYSYGINRYIFMGGAHGLSTLNYLVFDLKTGKRITEKDLFVQNYPKLLSELIKKRIVEQSKEDENSEPILDLDDSVYWVDAIKPNGNFYITDESVNYVFNPFEIAPSYVGQTEVVIPFERLKEIFKPNNVISYLINKEGLKN